MKKLQDGRLPTLCLMLEQRLAAAEDGTPFIQSLLREVIVEHFPDDLLRSRDHPGINEQSVVQKAAQVVSRRLRCSKCSS